MPKNPNGPVRRGQLISPFGVGALVIVPGGVSLIVSGLDFWFKVSDQKRKMDFEEFKFNEWRLQNHLGVNHFRLPPDFRDPFRNPGIVNPGLTIPSFRFPAWYFCPDKKCRLLINMPMTASGKKGRIPCPDCRSRNKTRYLYQVPFVAMCENGHLQDFPWLEWVHHEPSPSCIGPLRLFATGGASLAGQKVSCDGCGKTRTLGNITNAFLDGSTYLSKNLQGGKDIFFCHGQKIWFGEGEVEPCGAHLRGSLRSASNLYYPKTFSAIYLPITEEPDLQELEGILTSHPVDTYISLARDLGSESVEKVAHAVRTYHARLLSEFTEAQITKTLQKIFSSGSELPNTVDAVLKDNQDEFKHAEYVVLKSERNDQFLQIKAGVMEKYDQELSQYLEKIMLIHKLLETRVFTGFSRIFSENETSREQTQALIWKELPPISDRWLPAYKVYGEGIFLEFSISRLRSWESLPIVQDRITPLLERHKIMLEKRHLREREISARFVLLHTFAHVFINRLTFECGYSSASLRERIYVSNDPKSEMAGVLIYTADGDSEGTMGGLVRMGKPGNIEPVIRRALDHARWCSSDPVCMEIGRATGQGPDSCNLAACHSCSLVPETACEEFNHYLDRGLLIGDFENPTTGYFTSGLDL